MTCALQGEGRGPGVDKGLRAKIQAAVEELARHELVASLTIDLAQFRRLLRCTDLARILREAAIADQQRLAADAT